ncbi:putative GTP binding protein [Taphrina deformans PYCC 5710]|uniref:GTP-binding protein 8 n=1 Tax=Taphrina deformans (strain PYCC 5710 / ATCC 11124 / CBS 356.35 / IMI 108563 / JCM 9778 / NBRC 8474) TaxID=1097556 RepID=R4XE31_TAPDE|nr:putative GTP binding protein [Taphrina deformans PYCC 5710]|eukprot:CCG82690.1 putative GTP binding protein [Taphrina deformans PYCC 5710]
MNGTKTKARPALRVLSRRWDGLLAPTPREIEASKRIFAHEGRFVWSASSVHVVPEPSVPEIAFLGRSNVGKSTLLNVLLGRKRHKLVRTSSRPGQTQALNGFSVGGEVCLVDTPGYGYRSREAWGPLIETYLRSRRTLKRACLLVEASHGFKTHDEALVHALARDGVPFQVVLTKVDKLAPPALLELLAYSETYLRKAGKAAVWGEVLGVSSDERRLGIPELRSSLCLVSGLLSKSVLDGTADALPKKVRRKSRPETMFTK